MAIQASYKGMNINIMDIDNEVLGYFEGAARKKFVIRKCTACGLLRWPPTPGCPWCTSMEHTWQEVSGKGTIYSYQIVTQPIQPGFVEWVPYPIVLVELDEQSGQPDPEDGIRILMNLVDANFNPEKAANVAVGKRVEVVFQEINPEFALPQWKLSGEPDRPPVWQHHSNLE